MFKIPYFVALFLSLEAESQFLGCLQGDYCDADLLWSPERMIK